MRDVAMYYSVIYLPWEQPAVKVPVGAILEMTDLRFLTISKSRIVEGV
jgi:hypothetical protein